MKIAVVTGAFGFAGANLVEELLACGYKVYAVGRKKASVHNDRFKEQKNLVRVFYEMEEYDRLFEAISQEDKPDVFFHLAWGGGRDDFEAQYKNIDGALKALDAAFCMNENIRFVGIGSQAEYGVVTDEKEITEECALNPFSAYGACKTAAYYLLRKKAEILGVDFIWGRIFSLIGKYEPSGRMLPDLVMKLADYQKEPYIKESQQICLSSCEQYWDYLDATDAARAIIALGEKGKPSQVYNIANGDYRPLKEFVLDAAKLVGTDASYIKFGDRVNPFVSLRPSVSKIKNDTGWEPVVSFSESIKEYSN